MLTYWLLDKLIYLGYLKTKPNLMLDVKRLVCCFFMILFLYIDLNLSDLHQLIFRCFDVVDY